MHETAVSHFFLEHPAPGQPLPAGRQTLRGWLVAKTGHHFVDLRVRTPDGLHPAEFGHPRRDLARFFGSSAPWLPAGFELALAFAPGETRLEFEACDLTGSWSPVARVTLTAVPPTDPPAAAPPVSPLLAHEFARALQLLLRRLHQEQDRPLLELTAEVAAATPWPCAVRFPHRPFHGHLDEPAAIARAGFGRLTVLGWLFHETLRLRRVLATFDLQAFQALRHGGPFAGVSDLHPQFEHAKDCALEGQVDVPAQLAQPRALRIYAELDDGSWHLAHVQRTRTFNAEEEKLRYVRYAPLMFWRAACALRSAFARVGVPVEPGGLVWRETWPLWREYRARAPRRDPPAQPPLAPPAGTSSSQSLGRVLLVSHNLSLEGAPLFFWEYARHLVRHGGARLDVISGEEGPLRTRYESLGASVRVVPLAGLMAAASARAMRREIRALGASMDFAGVNLVVANTLASFWAVHAARAAGKPALLYIHESTTPGSFFLGRLAPAALPVVEEAFARATRVSFLTAATRRYFDDLTDRPNYCLNPGWIDLRGIDAFRVDHPAGVLRAKLGLRDDERLVVNVGAVCERKGQTIFARAVDLLWREAPGLAERCRFLMVGARATLYDQDLADFVRELARPNLQVVPETPEVYGYYGAADLAVCTSYEESFPRVILEAMGFALPIVSTDVHGVPEIVRHGEEAVLVPPGDTQALAEALHLLLSDPVRAGALATRARQRVETTFTLDQVLPGHLVLARALASRHV
jgi:glycosyltransferase involved in cell wall biosynthesis